MTRRDLFKSFFAVAVTYAVVPAGKILPGVSAPPASALYLLVKGEMEAAIAATLAILDRSMLLNGFVDVPALAADQLPVWTGAVYSSHSKFQPRYYEVSIPEYTEEWPV